jgi:hypothetical protein
MGLLADTLVQRGGYNMQDALNAERGPRAAELAREFGVGSGGGGNPLQDVNKAIEDAFKRLQSDLVNRYGQYKASNPFVYDEVFAAKTKEASEQIDPYYSEKLSDYMLGVTRKITRSKDDAKSLLDELSADVDSYTDTNKLKLTEAISRAGQGRADAGMYFSGDRMRDEGLLEVGANKELADFNRNALNRKDDVSNTLSRTIQDTESARTADVRDIERNRFTDTQTRAGQLTKETGQRYVQGFKATLPPELQAQSGFDILKDLGIYS